MAGKAEIIANVLRMRRYAAISVVSGMLLGVLYYFLTMSFAFSHAAVEPLFLHVAVSIALTVVIAALAGISIALIIYRTKRMRMAGSNASAVAGGALAAFTPGCPACTAPLAVVLGAVGGLAAFPLLGLELKFVSIGALLFSIYWIARGLQRKSCCTIK